MGTLFGTDGIRGVANEDLSPELAFRLGRAAACYFTCNISHPRIVIGRDTRISGDMLEGAFLAGACSIGADVLKVGIIPTPAVAFLTRQLNAQMGVMISASHNPIGDNGIKLFSHEGYKLPDEDEERIEELVLAPEDTLPRPVGEDLGRVTPVLIAEDMYCDHVKKSVGGSLTGIKVVLDCAFGAAFRLAPRIFTELGASVIALHDEPDGLRINVQCGSTNMGHLKKVILAKGASAGLAFDGDADRCLAVDEMGKFVDGDQILTIAARFLKESGKLGPDVLVATVMSNLGMEQALDSMGIKLIRTKVGDRHVIEEMKRRGALIGGEQSGHIILLEHNTTGDGIATAVLLARILKESGKPLHELAACMKHMPQLLVNVKARHKDRLSDDEDISAAIKETEELLKDRGRLLVRPSGTEPLIRVMAEGPDEKELNEVVGKIASVIADKLG
ncbi:MAG: phosphoglucosamine mutase [Candidatus Eremiobacteraeota bacterium]|nr:phosphoglucosamine mutase [Candidatus Eremiobacteraeota bacterium]